jgi:L-ascorbate 6-phosphate lactonase
LTTTSLTWLGQAGFLIELQSQRILLDPFLSEHPARLYPPPRHESLTTGIDWLFATHEHLDHLDLDFLTVLAERSPDVGVVLPAPLAPLLEGIIQRNQIRGVAPADTVELADGVVIEVVPAFHAVEVADGYSDGSARGGVRFVGYVIRTPSGAIYHSGDTIVNDELLTAVQSAEIDVALLPINGRDHFRESEGLVGNMNVREAVRVAAAAGAHTLIPMHWDLFRGNTASPGSAVDEVVALEAPLHVLTVSRMRPFYLPPRPRNAEI